MAEDVAALPATGITPGDLRRRAPGQLRLLRLARARPRHRPERLRRGPSRLLGVGPAPAGRQHLGGRPGERCERDQCEAAVLACVAAYRARSGCSPSSRCCRAPTSGWTSTSCTRRPPSSRCGTRSSGRPSGRATARATGRCPASPREVDGPPTDRRGAAADHPAPDDEAEAVAAAPRRVPAHPRPALAPRARRLHARRHRPQGGRRRQRRPARVRRAARGQQPRRRGLPAAQAGPALGAGPVRARRLGLARAPGPAGRRVPAGAADGERPAARLDHGRATGSTTCGSSAT